MNLTPEQINELLSIIDTHLELLNDRLAYFQGDINGNYFNKMIADRTRLHLLRNAVKSLGDIYFRLNYPIVYAIVINYE